MKVFNYSIVYLMALFAFLLVDHYLDRAGCCSAPHCRSRRSAELQC